jgi:hypothetical protein
MKAVVYSLIGWNGKLFAGKRQKNTLILVDIKVPGFLRPGEFPLNE